jgi:large subunit ribosomal protein L28
VTTSVLRTIDKKGGLDKYLLETKDKNLQSVKALDLKNLVLKQQNKRPTPSAEA